MTAETALRLGQAAGLLFTRGTHRHRVVIGKDTRLSGYMIEPALTAGFIGAGMDVTLVGPLPTPAIAMLTRSLRADLGVMISASHNPFEDNGIKLFGPDGFKLSDETEARDRGADGQPISAAGWRRRPRSAAPRAWRTPPGAISRRRRRSFPRGLRLDGLKIVVDCANGAAYRVAPTVLWELGADVIPRRRRAGRLQHQPRLRLDRAGRLCAPRCGEHGAHLGIALDGDADRLIMADETRRADRRRPDPGADRALLGREPGGCAAAAIVATVMSNLGLERFLAGRGLTLHRTAGRRPLRGRADARRRHECRRRAVRPHDPVRLRHHRRRAAGRAAGAGGAGRAGAAGQRGAAALFTPLPQLLQQRALRRPLAAATRRAVQAAIAAAEAALNGTGRLLIRESGTEPLIRVMAEGEDEALVERLVDVLCDRIAEAAARRPTRHDAAA